MLRLFLSLYTPCILGSLFLKKKLVIRRRKKKEKEKRRIKIRATILTHLNSLVLVFDEHSVCHKHQELCTKDLG